MIVCFRCTAETRQDLDQLLASGSYRDYADAISAAVRTLLVMEQEVAENGAIVIGGTAAVPNAGAATPDRPVSDANGLEKASRKPGRNGSPKKLKPAQLAPPIAESPCVPQLFLLEGFPHKEPAGLAELPPDLWSDGQTIPLDRWVLGQYNRLLPAKVNARALVRLFLDSPKGLEIAGSAATVAVQAAVLGDYLRAVDAKHEIARDDALATAFPSAEEGADKGRNRYANQFVVYQNSRGELSGLMVDLKLINVVQVRRERRIVPTRVAWELASLPNPLLDAVPDEPPDKFNAKEREFLTDHILRSVPVETFAYRVILEAVSNGHTSPEQIDAAMKSYLDGDRADTLSQSFLASQRSGAVSRMSDLGLIQRRRDGVRVNYTATEDGLAFLKQSTSHQTR
jgi:hypothetical protein